MFAKFQVSPYLSASIITKPCILKILPLKKMCYIKFQFLCYLGKGINWLSWFFNVSGRNFLPGYGLWQHFGFYLLFIPWIQDMGKNMVHTIPINVRQQVQLSWTVNTNQTIHVFKLHLLDRTFDHRMFIQLRRISTKIIFISPGSNGHFFIIEPL